MAFGAWPRAWLWFGLRFPCQDVAVAGAASILVSGRDFDMIFSVRVFLFDAVAHIL